MIGNFMATSRIQFFSTLEEIPLMLCPLVRSLNLCIFLYRGGSTPIVEDADSSHLLRRIQALGASRLYLGESGSNIFEIDPTKIAPGRLGLLQVILPQKADQTLFMAEVSVKTDWIDSTTGDRSQNPQLMLLFKKVKKELLKSLKAPVLGLNIVTNRSDVYSTLLYTEGAKAFADNGGVLMQEGVNNVRFSPVANMET